MARDNSHSSDAEKRLTRLRSTPLAADIDAASSGNTDPEMTVPETPPIPDLEILEEGKEPTQRLPVTGKSVARKKPSTAEMATADPKVAEKKEQSAPQLLVTEHVVPQEEISLEETGVADPEGAETEKVEIEEQPTRQIPVTGKVEAQERISVEETVITDLKTTETVAEQPTQQLPVARSTALQDALSAEKTIITGLKAVDGVEDQPTRQLPASGRAIRWNAISAEDSVIIDLGTAKEVEEQPTRQLPVARDLAAQSGLSAADTAFIMSARPRTANGPAALVLRFVNSVLLRLQEPQPEGLETRGLQVVKPATALGLFPLLTLTNALGLLVVSISYYLGFVSVYALEFPFLFGLLLIFVPNLLRLLSSAPSRFERMYLLCGLGLTFYIIALMMSPLHISTFDEFLHWITADNILRTKHLFSENSLLPVSPYYPGLELVTNAISSLTGLNTFYSSIPLIAASRILTVLALFLFYEKITNSSRMAGIATAIYMANPHFIFFDVAYSYETIALPLAICVLYILARFENVGGEHRWIIFTSWIVVCALTFSHHMTDYVFNGLLLLWVVVSFFSATPRKARIHLITLLIFSCVLAVACAFLVQGNPVWGYLSSYFEIAFQELGRIITGSGSSRPLFTSTGAAPSPIWDRFLMLGSVAFVAFSLPFGLLTLWRLHRRYTLPMMLGIFTLAYPVAQAFRFTSLGSEIADRSAAFLFLAVAYVMTVLITHFWPTRGLSKRTIALVAGVISVILLGGVILDAGAGLTELPGPYAVGADNRSIEADGIDAALWSLAYLGPNNRLGTDRTDQMLMSTYGDQRIVTELDDNLDVSPLFASPQFDDADRALLSAGKIHYIVVDERLSTAVPVLGFYFVTDEPGAYQYTTPLSREALNKFDTVPQINRLFDNGNVVIYDTGAFLNETESP